MSTTVELETPGRSVSASDEIKLMPQALEAREMIRKEAAAVAAGLCRCQSPKRPRLETLGRDLLGRVGLNGGYLGFAMVSLSNAFWRDQFSAVPFSRRLLLLPHCLRKTDVCAGTHSALGLACAQCGACALSELQQEAEARGYRVLIAEGTPAVVQVVLKGQADAVLGVACLDSLEKAFRRVAELGIPHAAVPLLTNGCADTVAELDLVRNWMGLSSDPVGDRTRSYVSLFRASQALFERAALRELLSPYVELPVTPSSAEADPMTSTEAIAAEWLYNGGKRFRPFIVLASYAALVHGRQVMQPDADLTDAFPPAVKRVAVAIETLHKASLVHDDIEDDDLFRYGRETLHRRYGQAAAINVGDYLIGLGYQLIASEAEALGAECVADILARLSEAHLKLCRGQGTELALTKTPSLTPSPMDMLTAYSQKTAPAFEIAMYAGLRMAGTANVSPDLVRSFCRNVGVAYQILNDLQDWQADDDNKLVAGQDVLSARPTILHAFALEAGDDSASQELLALIEAEPHGDATLDRLREIYHERGAFDKAERLVEKCRSRAKELAEQVEAAVARELMTFIVEVLL